MTQEIIFRKSISLGAKTKEYPNAYGHGFNYVVEAGFLNSPGFERGACLEALEKALAKVDHKALGADVDLGVEPTSAKLCLYLQNQIRQNYPKGQLTSLKLNRGDGLAVSAGPFIRI